MFCYSDTLPLNFQIRRRNKIWTNAASTLETILQRQDETAGETQDEKPKLNTLIDLIECYIHTDPSAISRIEHKLPSIQEV